MFAIAVGLPWSKVPLSLGTFVLALNLVLKGDFKTYWIAWKSNSLLWFFFLYIGIEWLSLSWSNDWQYALIDLRIKLPLYLIPLVITAFPIGKKEHLYYLALAFLGSLFITSFINVGSYFHWWGNKEYDDIRSLSLFVSHIRYSLEIVMGMVLCIGWMVRKLPFRFIPILLIPWFLFYTYYSQIVSGYAALATVVLIGVLLLIRQLQSRTIKTLIFGSFIAAMGLFSFWIYNLLQPVPHKIELDQLPEKTASGNPYTRDKEDIRWENGYPIIALICNEELAPAWNAVSPIDYETGKDKKGNSIHFTLWRYMASLGLPKDSTGFSKLTQKDVQNIQNGIASVLLAQGGMKARIYGIQSQLEYPENPNGHSLLQRIEFWKAALHIIQKNWIIGVGSGDVEQAFHHYYTSNETLLLPENQKRAHNQFLTSWISSGIFGFLAFIAWWLIQWRFSWQQRALEWVCFVGICLSSFFTEDTIETQIGLTFVAFFFALFSAHYRLLYSDKRLS